MLPKCSVIVPLYNYDLYIGHCIESIITQRYDGEVEIVVVNDGSTDNSLACACKYEGRPAPGRTVLVIDHGENRGYSIAKNSGIEASTGDLITLLDADDMLTEGSLSIRANYLKGHSEMGVHGSAYIIRGDEGAAYYKSREYKLGISMRKDKIHAQTFMLRREVYKMYGLYDENLRSRSDNEFNRRLIDVVGLTFKRIIPQPIDERRWEYVLAYYRKHEKSMVVYRKNNKEYNNEVTRILEEAKSMRLRDGITKENTKFLEQ